MTLTKCRIHPIWSSKHSQGDRMNSLVFTSVIVIWILCIILTLMYFYKLGVRRGIADEKEEVVVKTAANNAILMQENIRTLEKYDILFSSDIVLFIMTQVPPSEYKNFIEGMLSSLRNIAGSIPKGVKIVVLRAIKINNIDNEIVNYVFEPLLDTGTKEAQE